jgi:hypothetical protein
MNEKTLLIVVVAGFIFLSQQPSVSNSPVGTEAAVNESIVASLKDVELDKRQRIAALYTAMADVTSRMQVVNTAKLRQWKQDSDLYFVRGTNLVGSAPKFTPVVNEELTKLFTLDDRDLTSEEMNKLVKFYETVAASARK